MAANPTLPGSGDQALSPLTESFVNAVLRAPTDQLTTAEQAMQRDFENNLAVRDQAGNVVPDTSGFPQSL
ncbi:MAG: hypothetical protein ACRDT8_08495, partial [Micromonosporaceae bacterium]